MHAVEPPSRTRSAIDQSIGAPRPTDRALLREAISETQSRHRLVTAVALKKSSRRYRHDKQVDGRGMPCIASSRSIDCDSSGAFAAFAKSPVHILPRHHLADQNDRSSPGRLLELRVCRADAYADTLR